MSKIDDALIEVLLEENGVLKARLVERERELRQVRGERDEIECRSVEIQETLNARLGASEQDEGALAILLRQTQVKHAKERETLHDLLRDLVSMNIPRTAKALERAKEVLAASAEPSAPKCGHPACASLGEPHPFCEFVKELEQAEPSAPVERADFERHVASSWKGLIPPYALARHPVRPDCYECSSMQNRWTDWQARAALDKK